MNMEPFEILEKLRDVLGSFNCETVVKALDDYFETGNTDGLEEKIDDLIETTSIHKFFYSFQTRDGEYTIKKRLIEAFIKRLDESGNPIIEINPIEDSAAQFKNNPIKNLVMIYSNEESRDCEYEKLKIMML